MDKHLDTRPTTPASKVLPSVTRTIPQQRNPWYTSQSFLAFAAILPVVGTFAIFVPATLWTVGRQSYGNSPIFSCDPNGDVSTGDGYSPWDIKYTLSVSLGFGEMRYSTAKTIDVLWDLIVGRGCQAVAAIVVYYVFRSEVLSREAQRPTPFATALAMEYHTTSFSALLSYSKGVTQWFPWKSRPRGQFLTSVVLVVSTIYVLALPTWLSAMTAYQAIVHPVLPYNGSYVAMDEMNTCVYFIYDGSRAGLLNDECVQQNDDFGDDVNSCKFISISTSLTLPKLIGDRLSLLLRRPFEGTRA